MSQLPGRPVYLLGLEVRPLISKFIAIAKQSQGLLVLGLRLHLEGLAVLVCQAVPSLLDLLVQDFAQLSGQFFIR